MANGFEQINLGYSTKNIPLPSEKDYLKCMISKVETFLRNIRWRTFFFLNPETTTEHKETYGFKSTKPEPFVPELKEFEDGMLELVQNVQFKKTSNQFQKKLSEDVQKIKSDSKLFVAADKTTNFYKLDPDSYNDLLEQNITKDYKKAKPSSEKRNNLGDKEIADNLDISDRIDTKSESQAFITLKDHKPNFKNRPTCRLINPCKSEIGKISKQTLQRINAKIINSTKFNQWKNTDEVIHWFNNVDNKHKCAFISFDVCEFYPSISEDLLNKALDFASMYDKITDNEKHIIRHAKKSSLYNKGIPWSKRGDTNFDVTMGSFDGAETCELVGLYLLSQLQDLDINVGLYRDDGLAICHNKTARQIELIKKKICTVFANNNLRITIEANKKSIDFLDITMNLSTGSYSPFTKPNNIPLYVNKDSNHPPNIIKNIPESINNRLSKISSTESIFKNATPEYQEALNKSGYDHELKFNPNKRNNSRNNLRKRTRRITWFNPPYSENVDTNIGRKFFLLLDKCFPPGHQLHKLLNRNTVKLSYSCMPNIKQIISSHNTSVLKKSQPQPDVNTNTCNCRDSNNCPLENKCLISSVIYQATVTRDDINKDETYVGLTENTFKSRFNGHTASFRNSENKHATTLSEYVWSLKDNNVPFSIKWKILSRAKAYSTARKLCNLCIEEKYFIIRRPDLSSLNKRNELLSACRHRKKHLLCNYN